MRNSRNHYQRGSRADPRGGVALVEFALVAPIVFAMVLGLVEFGRMVMVQQALTNSAREGCRKAILASTVNASDVDGAINGYLQGSVANTGNIDDFRITCTPAPYAAMPAETEILVTVEVDYADVSWIPASFLGSAVLRSRATMKRE